MPVTTTNLIQGPATLYVGAFGATEPTDALINTAPAVAWTDLGGTTGGVTLTAAITLAALDVDQILDPVGDVITARDITVATSLAEATLANLARVLNLADAVVTTGTTPAGPTLEPVSDVTSFTPVYRAFILDGIAPGGFRRRIILRKAIQTAAAALPHAPGTQTVIPATFRSTYVSASVKPFKIIDGIA
jgi:hypothetical protein